LNVERQPTIGPRALDESDDLCDRSFKDRIAARKRRPLHSAGLEELRVRDSPGVRMRTLSA
jgi:hypothetical protein